MDKWVLSAHIPSVKNIKRCEVNTGKRKKEPNGDTTMKPNKYIKIAKQEMLENMGRKYSKSFLRNPEVTYMLIFK